MVNMNVSLKKRKFMQLFDLVSKNAGFESQKRQSNIEGQKIDNIKKMFKLLNDLELKNENRFILCNFIDQYSDILEYDGDIYFDNANQTLQQIQNLALTRAKQHDIIDYLYEEYTTCVQAIGQKKEFQL
ncbi:MAG: hypothetical protein ACOC44_03945 [Promethearchaeia archaeon]